MHPSPYAQCNAISQDLGNKTPFAHSKIVIQGQVLKRTLEKLEELIPGLIIYTRVQAFARVRSSSLKVSPNPLLAMRPCLVPCFLPFLPPCFLITMEMSFPELYFLFPCWFMKTSWPQHKSWVAGICPFAVTCCVIPFISLFCIKQRERLSEEKGKFSSLTTFWLWPLNVEDMRMAALPGHVPEEYLHVIIPYTPLCFFLSFQVMWFVYF